MALFLSDSEIAKLDLTTLINLVRSKATTLNGPETGTFPTDHGSFWWRLDPQKIGSQISLLRDFSEVQGSSSNSAQLIPTASVNKIELYQLSQWKNPDGSTSYLGSQTFSGFDYQDTTLLGLAGGANYNMLTFKAAVANYPPNTTNEYYIKVEGYANDLSLIWNNPIPNAGRFLITDGSIVGARDAAWGNWLELLNNHGAFISYVDTNGGGAVGGPSTTVQQEIMGLYAALYGRAGEYPGYDFWVKSAGGGVTTGTASTTPVSNSAATALGNGFVAAQSTYFDKTYGSLSDSQFIDAMYVNIGGAKPDPAGNAYWSGLLAKAEASGLSVQAARAGLVGTFVDALVEFNTTARPVGLTDQQWTDALTRQNTINNKIEVSQGYANASNGPNGAILVPHAPDDAAYQAATRALQGVTSDHTTVVTVLANISSAVLHQDLTLI